MRTGSWTNRFRIYFTDTGLAAWLARYSRKEDVEGGVIRGELFENHVILEIHKRLLNAGETPDLYFYRSNLQRRGVGESVVSRLETKATQVVQLGRSMKHDCVAFLLSPFCWLRGRPSRMITCIKTPRTSLWGGFARVECLLRVFRYDRIIEEVGWNEARAGCQAASSHGGQDQQH